VITLSNAPQPAQSLERAWLAMAAAALAVAACCALVAAAARTPWLGAALGLQSLFAPALVVHVVLATIVWLLGVGASQWVTMMPMNKTVGWVIFSVAALGALALPATLATGAEARLFNYLPLLAHPLFLSGLAWFALALIAVTTITTFKAWHRGNRRQADNGLSGFALRCALIPAWLTWMVFALAWMQLRGAPALEHGEFLFWAPGHTLQFVFTALMVAAWVSLSPLHESASRAHRMAALLTVIPALLAPLPFVLFAMDSAEFRSSFTWLMALGTWIGPIWVAFLLVRSGRNSADRPLFVTLSVALFALGALVGALIDADTTTVPAHYHGTVGAATLAAMGLVSARLGVRSNARDALPWLYVIGFALIVIGFAVAGGQSTPRKLPGAAIGAAANVGLTLMSAGATAAIAAVLWFTGRVARALIEGRGTRATRRTAIDQRPRALAVTVLSVALLGGIFAWSAGWTGPRPSSAPSATFATVSREAAAEVRLRFDQGVVMLHARQYEHATTAFHRVLALAPQMPEAHVNMGFALLGQKRHREATDFFASAIELRREQPNAYYGLAVALEANGDLRGAIGAMRTYVHRAQSTDPYRRKAEAALWEWESQLAQASADVAQPR